MNIEIDSKNSFFVRQILVLLRSLTTAENTGFGERFCLAMDKYRLVQEHTAEADNGTSTDNDNTENDDSTMSCEVRITQQGKPRNYISYAMKLFVRVNKPIDESL